MSLNTLGFLTFIHTFIWSFPHTSVDKESAVQETPVVEGIGYPLQYSWAFLTAQLVKNPPAMWETWVGSLGWEKSPGEGKGYPHQYSGLENSMD